MVPEGKMQELQTHFTKHIFRHLFFYKSFEKRIDSLKTLHGNCYLKKTLFFETPVKTV